MKPVKYWMIEYYLSRIEPTEFAKNKDLYTQVYLAADVEAREREIVQTLDHILKCWNGHHNEQTMVDALVYIETEAQRLLTKMEEKP